MKDTRHGSCIDTGQDKMELHNQTSIIVFYGYYVIFVCTYNLPADALDRLAGILIIMCCVNLV